MGPDRKRGQPGEGQGHQYAPVLRQLGRVGGVVSGTEHKPDDLILGGSGVDGDDTHAVW